MVKNIVLTNCNIVDVDQGIVRENESIAIKDGSISAFDRGENDSQIIDMRSYFITPGLMNLHSHLSLPLGGYKSSGRSPPTEPDAVAAIRACKRALDALNAGVTLVRSTTDASRSDIYLRDSINSGWMIGPRVLACGKGIGVTGGHGGPLLNEADGPYEFAKMARREIAYGADHLKIFISGGMGGEKEAIDEPQMTREEVRAVTSVARNKHTYVTAHAGGSQSIIEAAQEGVICFEHGYILNREAAKAIKAINGYLDPTLSVTRAKDWYVWAKFDDWLIEKSLKAGPRHEESLRYALDEGVTITCGTDVPPGDLNGGVESTIREVGYLQECGLKPLDAVRAATLNAAKCCRVDKTLGQLKEGYYADLIATPKNPIKDAKSLEHIEFVMKAGQVIRNDMPRK